MPDNSVDILEDWIPRELLEILLADHTTGKNILWATDIGGHDEHDSIEMKDIVGVNGLVLRPRVKKSDEEKKLRTKKRAEVFTTSWVCNEQLNAADTLWFFGSAAPGKGSPFNSPCGKRWKITTDDILRNTFAETGKNWEQYVLEDRIEMCCGEGPYLTSRYDVVTEREIPVRERIGILDRKLRVVNAFVGADSGAPKQEWTEWIIRAYQHTYGFEWQGDNLLLTREALLYTLLDHLKAYNLKKALDKQKKTLKKSQMAMLENLDFDGLNLKDYDCIKTVCHIVSWNIWQMDGLTGCPPYIEPTTEIKKLAKAINKPQTNALFSNESTFEIPSEFCKLMDWDENKETTYVEVYASAIKDRPL